MKRLKSAASTTLAGFLVMAALGMFATFGLAVVGVLAMLGLIGTVAAGVSGLTAPQPVSAGL